MSKFFSNWLGGKKADAPSPKPQETFPVASKRKRSPNNPGETTVLTISHCCAGRMGMSGVWRGPMVVGTSTQMRAQRRAAQLKLQPRHSVRQLAWTHRCWGPRKNQMLPFLFALLAMQFTRPLRRKHERSMDPRRSLASQASRHPNRQQQSSRTFSFTSERTRIKRSRPWVFSR